MDIEYEELEKVKYDSHISSMCGFIEMQGRGWYEEKKSLLFKIYGVLSSMEYTSGKGFSEAGAPTLEKAVAPHGQQQSED